MKVSIGFRLQSGPWGGGNQFGRSLADYLRQQGVQVSFDLRDPQLDIILLAEPRGHLRSSAFTDAHIFRYLTWRNNRVIVVHRINECDERKGTNEVNRILRQANLCADHTVYVSDWLRHLHQSQGLTPTRFSVIHNGSDTTIFNPLGYIPWTGNEPLKLVTHHWSANWLKGFDIYQQLDELLDQPEYRMLFAFTYIGNLPVGFQFRHSNHVLPLSGVDLAQAIRQHHVYLTASMYEPGGNHQNEGALCGLPLLFRESGCLPEYCQGFGLGFNTEDFAAKLIEMRRTYYLWQPRMIEYPHTAVHTNQQYLDLFHELLEQRKTLLAARTWQRNPAVWKRILLPDLSIGYKIKQKLCQHLNR